MYTSHFYVDVGTYVNGGFSLQQRISNGSLRVVAYWQVGMSINVGVVEGILDIVFSAPESYKTGVTRGLFGMSGSRSDIKL